MLAEDADRLLKGKAAGRRQKLADRADIKRDQAAGSLRGPAGDGNARGDDLRRRMAGAGQLVPVRPEGVGVDHICPGLNIRAVDGEDLLGIGEVQQLGDRAEGQAGLLQHGAHRPVKQDERFLFEKRGKVHRFHPFFGRRSGRSYGSGCIPSGLRRGRQRPRRTGP